jgi:glycosyltransferase involved in cell wall biosynthesis
MGEKPRVLFLLFEGLAATVIESQVLANVRLLQDRGVASFEVWTFACLATLLQSSRLRQPSATELAQAPVRVFRGVRPLTLFAYFANVLILAWWLYPRRREFTHIHARTDYSAAVAGPVARMFGMRLIWDCRGDSLAEVEERLAGSRGVMALLVRVRLRELALYTRLAAHCCNTALFVTEELRTLHQPLLKNQDTAVVPCAAHEELFFFDPDLRSDMRKRLGYRDGQVVYVYSGSLTTYQCFRQTVEMFATVQKKFPDSRFLVLTPSIDEARKILQGLPEDIWQLHTSDLSEVNGYLNAADVGFLLRDASRTNQVAFPTKFAEYGLTGLGVVTTAAIPAVYRIAESLGNLLNPDDGIAPTRIDDRAHTARSYAEKIGRSAFVSSYMAVYGV